MDEHKLLNYGQISLNLQHKFYLPGGNTVGAFTLCILS